MPIRLWIPLCFAFCFLASNAIVGIAQEATAPLSETQPAEQTSESVDAEVEPKPTETKPNETAEKDTIEELIKAAAMGDRDRIKDLLVAGADINAVDKRGVTPYTAARIAGNNKIATMLEVLGANPDAEFDPRQLIEYSLRQVAAADKPGTAVLIAKDEEVLYSGGVGAANIEHDVPITTDTKFRIGSVSKQFTAAAILKLQEAGKLSVQDKLSKFVLDFPRGDEVTLHQLLTHTSGLQNYTSHPDFYATVASSVEPAEMLKKFKEHGFDSEPGEKFEYCNTGYFLLSQIVAEVSGKTFGEYLDATFFEPLGMTNTGTHNSNDIYKHEATGYSVAEDAITKALDWDMSRVRGAGDIYSTVGDLHRWNQAVFGGKVLNAKSLKAAHTIHPPEGVTSKKDDEKDVSPSEEQMEDAVDDKKSAAEPSFDLPYGYGWMMDEHRGLKRIGHSGGLNGFVTQLNYYPEHKVTVVAFHNAFPSAPEFTPSAISNKMAEVFLYQEMKGRPEYQVAEDVDPKTFDDYVGEYDYRSAIMTVTRDGDKLMAQLTGQTNFEIYPSAKDKFFWKVVNAQAEFQRDDTGNVTGVKHSQGISKFFAAKLEKRKEVKVSEENLDRYVGTYKYSPFSKLTIRREGDQLYGKLTGQPEQKLFTESDTKVFWRVVNAQLELEVNDDGDVTGASHHQSGRKIPVTKLE